MTVHTTPYVFTALEILTAAKLNAMQGNISADWPYTAAGQVAYSIASNELAVVAKPSVDSLLRMLSTGTPDYVPYSALKGSLHAIGLVDFNPGGQAFAGGWADITSATLTLTLAVTCTIVVLAEVTGYNGVTGNAFFIRSMVNGVADGAANLPFNGGSSSAARNEAIGYIYRATGVTAGSRIVKLQCQANGSTNYVERGRLMAAAFVE